MSRQRAGWGLTRFMEKLIASRRKKSEMAGKNKYPTPHSGKRECERRLRQIDGGILVDDGGFEYEVGRVQ